MAAILIACPRAGKVRSPPRVRCRRARDGLEAPPRMTSDTAVPSGYERIPCPLCGEPLENQVVLRGRDHVLNDPHDLTIVRCGACGLCFLNPRPLLSRLGEYYPNTYH